jgi:chromosome segregation ATPase
MADVETPIETLRDRLTGLLADWGAEFSMVLRELETKRARVKELDSSAAGRDDELDVLRRQVDGQEDLISTLKSDAEDASKLRREVHGKDLELDRLTSELDSKQELIQALRRDAERMDRLKGDGRAKDQEIARLNAEQARAERRANDLQQELDALKDSSEESNQDAVELEAVRAELDARKTLIESLRADADRLGALEARLEEKREVIAKLETSMNRHANTIAELKRSVAAWKTKYTNLRSKGTAAAATSTQLPRLTDTDIRSLEALDGQAGGAPERTIAIDMRESLLEARRTAHGTPKK